MANDGAEVTREKIVEVLGDRFAKWQLPDEIIVTEELPRTSVGKLDKKLLRKNWENEAEGSSLRGPAGGTNPRRLSNPWESCAAVPGIRQDGRSSEPVVEVCTVVA